MKPENSLRADAASILSKATSRAATNLGLSNSDLADVLGVSTSSVDRLLAQSRTIDPATKEGQLAAMLIRVFRSLDALLGDAVPHAEWMRAHTVALNGRAIDLIKTPAGITHTLDYLDGMRAAA